jgi:hypothetical protein
MKVYQIEFTDDDGKPRIGLKTDNPREKAIVESAALILQQRYPNRNYRYVEVEVEAPNRSRRYYYDPDLTA